MPNLQKMKFNEDIISRLECLERSVFNIGKSLEKNGIQVLSFEKKIRDLDDQESIALKSKDLYKKVIDLVYERNVGKIEETINLALNYIFFDKNYGSKIEVSDFRSKTIDIYLIDHSHNPPRKSNVKDGTGNGVRTVVSFVLLVYYLIRCGRKRFIIADEAYSAMSEEYVDKFFSFVSSLCKEKGLSIVLITHDPRFLIYADKRYNVLEGSVREVDFEQIKSLGEQE